VAVGAPTTTKGDAMKVREVDDMKEEAVRAYLKKLMAALDEKDGDDFFGTEGWRHYLMGED
jgi:hypothetical protein